MNRLNFSRSTSFDEERDRNDEEVWRILSHRHYQEKENFLS